MEKIQEMVKEIETLCNDFMVDAKNNLNGNKTAGRRARKTTQRLTQLFKEYRKETIEAEKAE